MKCPNCDHLLQITERQNVEIDYCPVCRGVWLDKGELDKIINFSNEQILQLSRNAKGEVGEVRKSNYGESSNHNHHYQPKKYHTKKSFFSNLFDFD